MHLGLIGGPFVPHNLISTQESPVSLLKFQMAPRLKILKCPLGPRKEPRYTFSFLSKVLANKLSPSSTAGPPVERDTCLREFFVSRNPHKNFSKYFFFLSKALRKSAVPYSPKAPLHVPQMQGQYGSRHPFPVPYLT